jgi:hypothetical protein
MCHRPLYSWAEAAGMPCESDKGGGAQPQLAACSRHA